MSEATKHIQVISSKSMVQRVLIANYLSGNTCDVTYNETSLDIKAVIACLDNINIAPLMCGESGTTFRLLLPLLGAIHTSDTEKDNVFILDGSLVNRPLSPLREQLEAHGMTLSPIGSSEFHVSGRLISGGFRIANLYLVCLWHSRFLVRTAKLL